MGKLHEDISQKEKKMNIQMAKNTKRCLTALNTGEAQIKIAVKPHHPRIRMAKTINRDNAKC